MKLKEYLTEAKAPEVNMTKDVAYHELKQQYGGKDDGRVYWQVSQYQGQVTVDWELTFRRNSSEGEFVDSKSLVNRCNDVLEGIAKKYAVLKPIVTLCTRENCKSADRRKQSDGDDAYSEYEQSIGGEVRFK